MLIVALHCARLEEKKKRRLPRGGSAATKSHSAHSHLLIAIKKERMIYFFPIIFSFSFSTAGVDGSARRARRARDYAVAADVCAKPVQLDDRAHTRAAEDAPNQSRKMPVTLKIAPSKQRKSVCTCC